jgi:hypothetical protein
MVPSKSASASSLAMAALTRMPLPVRTEEIRLYAAEGTQRLLGQCC